MPEGRVVVEVILVVVCILLSAFFSGSEVAFLSAQRVRVRHMVATGVAGARRMAALVEHPEKLLPTILLGNTLVNTAAAALGTAIALTFLKDSSKAVLASTVGVTVILLVFGETLPKTLSARRPERMALVYAAPFQWVKLVLFPVAVVLQWASRWVANVLVGKVPPRALVTEEEIKVMVSVGREVGTVAHGEAEMIHNVFRFGDRQVREVMTSRTEIVWVERGTTLGQFLELYGRHYHTRFPIFQGQVDNVIGVLSAKDVLRALARGELKAGDPVTTLLRAAYFVPETKPVAALFSEMREAGHQMAMVADEFGGVAGLVTLRRLVEEVVGRGAEEGVEAEEDVKTIDEHTYQVDAGIQVDEANQKLGLGIPQGDYKTVAGYLLERLGHIPQEGEHVHCDGLRLVVTEMRGLRIQTVTVTRATPPVAQRRH